MLIFHHARPLTSVKYDRVFPARQEADKELLPAYEWLEERIGFFPLFLAIGNQEWRLRMTGYQDQWKRFLSYDFEAKKRIYRHKGEFPNYCLFSFDEGTEGTFSKGIFINEASWWVFICGAFLNKRPDQITKAQIKSVFKRSWPPPGG